MNEKYISPSQAAARESISSNTGKKEELMKIGLELVSKKGLSNTSVNDIIKEAGVAKGTFYYYFTGKEDFIKTTMMAIWPKDSFADLESHPEMPITEKLSNFAFSYLSAVKKNMSCEFCRLWVKVVMDSSDPVLRLATDTSYLLSILEDARDKGELKPDTDCVKISKMIMSYLYGSCFLWEMDQENMDLMGTVDLFCIALKKFIQDYLQ